MYKVGDKVRVVSKSTFHGHEIGDIIEVKYVSEYSIRCTVGWNLYFSEIEPLLSDRDKWAKTVDDIMDAIYAETPSPAKTVDDTGSDAINNIRVNHTPDSHPTEVWIGWNGGEMPVPADMIVDFAVDTGVGNGVLASALDWNCSESPIIAYRVHAKPDEIHVLTEIGLEYDTKHIVPAGTKGAVIYREVIE